MKVTVVIPAHNEAKTLPACLEALANQKTAYDLEVIVVDNVSTDDTFRIAQSWRDRLKLYVLKEPVKGRGSARRRGFAAAHADLVLSTDADTVVPTNWVDSLVDAFRDNPAAVAISGSSHITDGTWLTNWTMRVGMPLSLHLYRLLIGHYMLTGANFIIHRATYAAAGGFDPTLDMLDDVDLSFRVARIGRIKYVREPRVVTEGDMFRQGYLKGFWHYAQHLPPLLRRYWLGGVFSPKGRNT